MRGNTRQLLCRLATLYPCVIVSGRARADLLSRLHGVELARIIGNHGAETEVIAPKMRRRVDRWQVVLETALELLAGVWVENKGLSLAVHYRQALGKADARRKIIEATRNLRHAVVIGGKQVVNVVLDQSPDKGEALAVERSRLGCNWVLYVGDDDNDEGAFALSGNMIAIRVGRKARSGARFYLRTQAEIDKLLEILVTRKFW